MWNQYQYENKLKINNIILNKFKILKINFNYMIVISFPSFQRNYIFTIIIRNKEKKRKKEKDNWKPQ